MTEDWLQANRAHWDERTPIHVRSEFYDVPGFLAGKTSLRPFELEEVGDVAGRDLVHLQCHFGLDTLSWARGGARVAGLDFSGAAIAGARRLTERAGLEADWVEADVYEAPAAFGGRTFDIVYTGLGAIIWLPDIRRWARTVVALLRPGGFLYLAEFHPIGWVFADEDLTLAYPYFQTEALVLDDEGSYADPAAATVHNRTFSWNHALGDVVTAVIEAGLTVELLREYPHTLFQRWPFLERRDDAFHLPADMPSLPLMFSLRARRAG